MYRLTRDELGPLLLNIEDQTFQRIPETDNKFFRNGKMFDYFDSLEDLILSGKDMAVIPFWVISFAEKGKRYNVKLLISNSEFTFWNVEKAGREWVKNEIVACDAERPYFGFFVRTKEAQNDCIIGAVMEIKKPGN